MLWVNELSMICGWHKCAKNKGIKSRLARATRALTNTNANALSHGHGWGHGECARSGSNRACLKNGELKVCWNGVSSVLVIQPDLNAYRNMIECESVNENCSSVRLKRCIKQSIHNQKVTHNTELIYFYIHHGCFSVLVIFFSSSVPFLTRFARVHCHM